MSLPNNTIQITMDNFIDEFSKIIIEADGDLNTIYKIVFRCGNDVSSYSLPPHLNPLRSQCSTTTNLVNFLLTDGKYIPEMKGHITDRDDYIKFDEQLDLLSTTNMINVTFNVNGANSGDGSPYFPGHIFNVLINRRRGTYKLIQSFLYNYTAKEKNFNGRNIKRDLFDNYYEIFILPFGMEFESVGYAGSDLMRKWESITDTNAFGYPNDPDIIGMCRPKFLNYSFKYQADDEYFTLFLSNIVRLLNLFYQKILYINNNIDNIKNALGSRSFTTIRQIDIDSLQNLLRTKYSNCMRNIIFSRGIHKYYLAKGIYFFENANMLILRENNDEENEKTIVNSFAAKNHPYLEINYNNIAENPQQITNYLTNMLTVMPLGKSFLVKSVSSVITEYKFITRLDANIFFFELILTDGVTITGNIQEQKTFTQVLEYINKDGIIFYF